MLKIQKYKTDHTLSYAEYGNPDGFPILIQHGLIASIKDAALFGRLVDAGARLICMARPGYGESSPYGMQCIGEWAEIVSTLVENLNLSHFDVLGMSSGAPYSYALGWRFPDKVRNIYIFSGIPALYADMILVHWPFEINKQASITDLQKLARELFFSNLSPVDLANDDIRDSMMHGCFGLAQDFKLRCLNWGFSLSQVKAPVYMQHSRQDPSVPYITAEITSRLLPNCRLEVKENDVHFSPQALDDFVTHIMLPNLSLPS